MEKENLIITYEELKNYLKVRTVVSFFTLDEVEEFSNNTELFELLSNLYIIILLQVEKQLKNLKWPISKIKNYINGREREVIEEYLCNYEINKGVSTEIAKFYAKEICEALNLTEIINIVVDKVTAEDKKIKTIR